MSGILPKSKTKGVDICAGRDNHYIIRSDLGCYMCSEDIHTGKNLNIYSLHPSCKDGDHYLCDWDMFYIIKGDSYRTVTDLTKDSDSAVYELHPNCRGGDHYLYNANAICIVFQSRCVYRETSDLNTDKDGVEKKLHPNLRGGLYYWNNWLGIFMLKQTDKWGVQMSVSCFLDTEVVETKSVHPDVVSFLPGGLAVTQGPAFARWELIKTIDNASDTPITWENKIKKKVGYNKSKLSSIEHNWKVSGNITGQIGKLTESLFKLQFSFSAEYGGQSVNTESENWEEATEEEESVNFTLQPKTKMYVWQYKLGLGKEDVLFCRDLRFSNDPNPPADTALKVLDLLKKDNSE